MRRKRSSSRYKLDAPVLERIRAIKADHPLWGYRRIWAYMRYRDNQVIGKNRVYRLMKEHQLLVCNNQRLKAKRYSTRPKPRAVIPNQYWGTDTHDRSMPFQFQRDFEQWGIDYNTDFPHQSLAYKTPAQAM